MPMNAPTLHCTYCGVAHTDAGWPKTCSGCARTTWKNPTPVAVMLLPVTAPRGLVVIRRGIEPNKGKLALPGGYVDWEESWQAAGARELREETGVEVDPGAIELFDVHSPPNGRTVLIFGLAEPVAREALPAFDGTDETDERTIIDGASEMAFPLHTQVVEAFFARG